MVAFAALALGTFVPAREPVASRCAPGTFDPRLARIDDTPLDGGSSASGGFVIGSDRITLGACGVAELHVRVRPRKTLYRARWFWCGRFGTVRYRAVTLYGPCDVVGSTFGYRDPRTGRRKTVVFNSTRANE
jgi:hypothetical protein